MLNAFMNFSIFLFLFLLLWKSGKRHGAAATIHFNWLRGFYGYAQIEMVIERCLRAYIAEIKHAIFTACLSKLIDLSVVNSIQFVRLQEHKRRFFMFDLWNFGRCFFKHSIYDLMTFITHQNFKLRYFISISLFKSQWKSDSFYKKSNKYWSQPSNTSCALRTAVTTWQCFYLNSKISLIKIFTWIKTTIVHNLMREFKNKKIICYK